MMDHENRRTDKDPATLSLGELLRQADALIPSGLATDHRRRGEELVAWMTADVAEKDHDNQADNEHGPDLLPRAEPGPGARAPEGRAERPQASRTQHGGFLPADTDSPAPLVRLGPLAGADRDPGRDVARGRRHRGGWRLATASAAAVAGFLLVSVPGPGEPGGPVATPTAGQTTAPQLPPMRSVTGSWIAQLASVPKTGGTASRDQTLAAIRSRVPTAEVLNSNAFASLRPGYWVVYEPGPYTSGAAAVDFCLRAGLTNSNDCRGRYLSPYAADLPLACEPNAHKQPPPCRTGERRRK